MIDRKGRRRPGRTAPHIAAGRARDVVEIVVREAGELNARRCLQTIVVVDDSCNARLGSRHGVGAFTTKVIDVDAIVAARGAATPTRKAGTA